MAASATAAMKRDLGPPDLLLRHAERLARELGRATTMAARLNNSHIRGAHGRKRPGQGDDFWQFRDYHVSDPADRIDWRRSARGDHLYVREREWTTAQNLYLWADLSPSMWFSTLKDGGTKADRAALIGLALLSAFSEGGERVALLGSGGRPAAGRFGLRRVAEQLSQAVSAGRADFPHIAGALPAGSHVLLISDFLDPIEVWIDHFKHLTGTGVTAHLIQILDPAEEDFPFKGRTTFEGLEGEGLETLGRAEALSGAYRDILAAHIDDLVQHCRALGWSYVRHRSDHGPAPCLMAAMAALSGGAAGERRA